MRDVPVGLRLDRAARRALNARQAFQIARTDGGVVLAPEQQQWRRIGSREMHGLRLLRVGRLAERVARGVDIERQKIVRPSASIMAL